VGGGGEYIVGSSIQANKPARFQFITTTGTTGAGPGTTGVLGIPQHANIDRPLTAHTRHKVPLLRALEVSVVLSSAASQKNWRYRTRATAGMGGSCGLGELALLAVPRTQCSFKTGGPGSQPHDREGIAVAGKAPGQAPKRHAAPRAQYARAKSAMCVAGRPL
jgi:hypothetical protein